MKQIAFLLLIGPLLLMSNLAIAQVPGIKWQKTFGGSDFDQLGEGDTARATHAKVSIPIAGGGYLVAGTTESNDDDVAGNHGNTDIWVARLDSSRNFLWKNCYGGSSSEYLGSIREVGDGGFILVGSTSSNNGNVAGNHGNLDVWVVRLDMSGNILWQKCFGGTLDDQGIHIEPTTDGGFILTGSTQSNDGDVSGLHGASDVWVAKLTNTGDLTWQKCFGGTRSESGDVIRQTAGGNYILAGETNSIDGDIVGYHDGRLHPNDIWAAELDSIGTLVWSRALGGSGIESVGDITDANDGGYVLAGSTSSTDGDISNKRGNSDGWIVKLSSSGTFQWQKCIGGSNGDAFSDIKSMINGGYILIGNTGSNDGDVSGLHGGELDVHDVFLARVNDSAEVIWTKCLGGSGIDVGASVYPIDEMNYVALGTILYSSDYDVTTAYGGADLWLVGLSSVNVIKGTVFLDQNGNGSKDANEPLISDAMVSTQKNAEVKTTTPFDGIFQLNVDTGSYTTQVIKPYYIASPSNLVSTFGSYFNTDSLSFALREIAGKTDLAINLIPEKKDASKAGYTVYEIIYKNVGTDTIPGGSIFFRKDPKFNLASSVPSASSLAGDTLIWNYSNLKPGDNASIIVTLYFGAGSAANLGDTVISFAAITPVAGDETPADDSSYLYQTVISSYDPNAKSENNGGLIPVKFISDDRYLDYTINFQNTGNDTAFSIVIRDTLEDKLNWSSFQMIASSHPYVLDISDQNKVAWTFSNIKLPDSTINEPASHGFITYRIKPRSTVVVGDTIHNSASIYFDFNPAVTTNRDNTVVKTSIVTGTRDVANRNFILRIFPNPSSSEIWLQTRERVVGNASILITDESGRLVYHENLGRIDLTDFTRKIALKRAGQGIYTIAMVVGNNLYTRQFVLQH